MDMSTYPLCPKCGGKTNTFRHPYAKVWCERCGYVLREEGEGAPWKAEQNIKKIDRKKLWEALNACICVGITQGAYLKDAKVSAWIDSGDFENLMNDYDRDRENPKTSK